MNSQVRIACLQVNVGNDPAQNIELISKLAQSAVDSGAEIIATPEYCFKLDGRGRVMRENAPQEEDHEGLRAMRSFSRDKGVWFLIGSIVVRTDGSQLANRSILIGPSGEILARYDKLHMFDLKLPDGREVLESRNYRPGGAARLVDTSLGKLGLTICYDLRFANLFQALAKAGAEIIFVPSAFYSDTGAAHWHTLLRARAIETGAFIVAPATCGQHPGEHATFGHSLVVSPWGEIIAEADTEPGITVAALDLAEVGRTRARMPSLQHGRSFDVETIVARP